MTMKLKNIIILLSAALMVLPSCHKKDEKTTTTPDLDGSLYFNLPMFVDQGETFTLIPKGASNPTTGNVGYCWYNSWKTGRDTVKRETGIGDGSWTVTVPSKTGTYTISCMAFANGYANMTSSKAFTVVDPSLNGSLKGAGYQVDSVKFTDPRDGNVYFLATAGGKVWMQNNLYFKGLGASYENSVAMDPIMGRLYNWKEAVSACPQGWHLPTDAEFAALAENAGSLMADVTFNDSKMWTFWPQVKITNASKFSAIPAGYAIDQEGSRKYTGTNKYAVFWTADNDEDSGVYRYIYVDKNIVYSAYGDKDSFLASVRCVKD